MSSEQLLRESVFHLVGRRPAARPVQAASVWPSHSAANGSAPPGLRPGADQGQGAGKARRPEGQQDQRAGADPEQGRGPRLPNTSKLNFQKLKGEPDKAGQNLSHCIKSFSSKARQIFEYFEFEKEIAKLDESDRLYLVIGKFADIDLHPDVVPNHDMGLIFEDLIRRFNEASNETAGDHFTPREVIRLMVNLLFTPDSQILRTKGIVKTLYDPACGTGGMLSVAEEHLRDLNPDARLEVFGQDYNNEAFAICCSDMMIKGQNPENIKFGDSFTQDGLPGHTFDYLLANPPFGVEWKPQAGVTEREHEELAFKGRFGAGLPRINDGSLGMNRLESKTVIDDCGTRPGPVNCRTSERIMWGEEFRRSIVS